MVIRASFSARSNSLAFWSGLEEEVEEEEVGGDKEPTGIALGEKLVTFGDGDDGAAGAERRRFVPILRKHDRVTPAIAWL